jgi:hypothetical protein
MFLKAQKFVYPALALALLVFAYQSLEWSGVALYLSAAVMWVLLHYSRMLNVFKRAAGRPVGFVASAVMLNAKLRKGLSLLEVIGLTRSLGKKETEDAPQASIVSESFSWADESGAKVICTFIEGRLSQFELVREHTIC